MRLEMHLEGALAMSTSTKRSEVAYSEEQVAERLAAELPHWTYENGGFAASTAPRAGKAR